MTHRYHKLLFFLSLTLMIGMRGVVAAPLTKPMLDQPITDPLLPTKVDRPLSPLEIGQIERKIVELQQTGLVLWQQQQGDQAFAQWFRQLRLRQVLPDRVAEVEALGRIGAIAWEDNRTHEVTEITKRLETIEQEDFPADYSLLLPLAEAYEKLRNSKAAITLYKTHLTTLEDPYKPEILRIIAQLAIDWFDYEEGLIAYQQIEALGALNIGDREQFARLYEQTGDPAKAIILQRQLMPLYLQDQELIKLVDVYQKISQNYHKLQNYKKATEFTTHAFTLAWQLKYFDAAEAALQHLAEIYLEQDKTAFSIQVYEQLLTVQNASYNRFGMMQTYEILGKLYQQSEQYPEALISWQLGLAIAKELNHDISYFTQAIETFPRQ